MSDVTISLRIDKRTHSMMKMHDEINWSAILRKIISEKLKQLNVIDRERAINAAKDMDRLRKGGVFDGGKSAVSIIREWRDKRR